MEQTVRDPNGGERRACIGAGVVFEAMALILWIADSALLTVSVVIAFGGMVIIGMGLLGRPYVVLDRNGVSYRPFIRKLFFRWDEVTRVGIRNMKGTRISKEYMFAVVIALPGKQKWQQCLFPSVVVPNCPEIKELIEKSYGQLDFDEEKELNDWEKRYYGVDK